MTLGLMKVEEEGFGSHRHISLFAKRNFNQKALQPFQTEWVQTSKAISFAQWLWLNLHFFWVGRK